MSNQHFKTPHLYALKGGELSISSKELLVLMEAVLATNRLFRFRAKGWSMAPFIRDGDFITVGPLAGKPPQLGEVLAFIHPHSGNLVVHRAIAVDEKGVLIRGDSIQAGPDGFIPFTDLVGRVTRVEREDRRVWIGLGCERYLVAWLSRMGWLKPIYIWLSKWFWKPLKRIF